ncbi:MAG: TrkA family potassium uptake protein [Chlamydiales bacterium]|nr:TrkA family potassium uptake protein [Chlamydiales bacterium]
MRLVFTGGGVTTVQAVKVLSEKGYEIIIIEQDKEKIEKLQDQVDCGLLEGDGADPETLEQTNPKDVDYLITFTDSDPDNILAGLVGKSMGFKNVIVTVRNVSYEKICRELGLEHTIVPSRSIANSLAAFIEDHGKNQLEVDPEKN